MGRDELEPDRGHDRSVILSIRPNFTTEPDRRLVADHLAGMSDRFALDEYAALYHPSGGSPPASAGRA